MGRNAATVYVLEAISKKGFWFKIAAGPRFPRCAGFPIRSYPFEGQNRRNTPVFRGFKTRNQQNEFDPPLAGWAKRLF
jgi:hypothetical protein